MIVEPWVVWSMEHNAYWKPDRRGYTENVLEAGVYTKDEAHEIERNAEPGNELALSLAAVLEVGGVVKDARIVPSRSVGAQLATVIRNLV